MKFGIILLVLIALCSVAGSVISQGEDVSYYAETYQSLHGFILMLGLDNVFKTWYFIALVALLSLNLILCSVIRGIGIIRTGKNLIENTSKLEDSVLLTEEGVEKLKSHLIEKHCKQDTFESNVIYSKNRIGRYGTFITHLAILLTIIFGAAALYLPEITDQTCFPGDSIEMDDGTQIYVDSFHIEDDTGELDYASKIQVTLPNGKQSEIKEISVNHPLSFGSYKIYQQTYGTAGNLSVKYLDTDEIENFTLDEVSFLSLDSVNGLWYEAVYPGYIEDENGDITLITSTTGSYTDPVYQVLIASDGVYTPVLAFPGDTLDIGNLEYIFNDPVEYPGLRIKYTPPVINALLCFSFALMIIGLFIAFFMQPVIVKVDNKGYIVTGPNAENTKLELKLLLKEFEKVEEIENV